LEITNFASIVTDMEKVRWGFIGAGYIAKLALYPALLNSKDGEIYAVGSKDVERGKSLSPSGLVYTDYDELLADPKVEAIYISLPNSLHIEWSIKAMRAGKHVLCEKPAAMNVAQLKEAIAVAKETGLIFMEASWNRWHPRTIRLKEIVDSGLIGEVKNNSRMRIPVFGNGDIDSPEKALEYKNRYGVDGIMIGRASIGYPWVFNEIKHFMATGTHLAGPSIQDRVQACRDHLEMSIKWKGIQLGINEMKRHYTNYFKGISHFKEYRTKLVSSYDLDEISGTRSPRWQTGYTCHQ
jgi:hypothetical protein